MFVYILIANWNFWRKHFYWRNSRFENLPKNRYQSKHHGAVVLWQRNDFEFLFICNIYTEKLYLWKRNELHTIQLIDHRERTKQHRIQFNDNRERTKHSENISNNVSICIFDNVCFHYFKFLRHFFYKINNFIALFRYVEICF